MTAKIDGTNGLLQNYDYQVLTTAFSYTFAAGTQILVINPAGTLATGTITMPASPADGMTITFSSTQTITALTVNANTGQSIVSAPTVLPARQAGAYIYRLSNTTWYPYESVPTNVPVAPAGGSIITSGTAVASTSGTSIDFTSIPSWVKRITIMFTGVSTSGTSIRILRIGAGSFEATGYVASAVDLFNTGSVVGAAATTYYPLVGGGSNTAYAASILDGSMQLSAFGSNTWNLSGSWSGSGSGVGAGVINMAGSKTTSGTLDRLRITTVNGTDTFDAGSINILYE